MKIYIQQSHEPFNKTSQSESFVSSITKHQQQQHKQQQKKQQKQKQQQQNQEQCINDKVGKISTAFICIINIID